jgi:hypothetical protein
VKAQDGNYLGQAHPDYEETNFNYDRATGRELKFEDLLGKAAETNIFGICRSQIAKQKMDRAVEGENAKDDIDPEEVASRTRAFSNWEFGSSSVRIYYGAYAFGGYGRCMCECSLPYATLRPLAKTEFPLP